MGRRAGEGMEGEVGREEGIGLAGRLRSGEGVEGEWGGMERGVGRGRGKDGRRSWEGEEEGI